MPQNVLDIMIISCFTRFVLIPKSHLILPDPLYDLIKRRVKYHIHDPEADCHHS